MFCCVSHRKGMVDLFHMNGWDWGSHIFHASKIQMHIYIIAKLHSNTPSISEGIVI